MTTETETLEAETVETTEAATETTEAATTATTETAEPFKLPDDFDWRTEFSGGDEKLLKLAGRYASPKAMLEATAKMRDKVAKGFEPLGDDATDDEKAAYRKAMDIPDAPADYMAKLPEGLVVGEDDKPFVDVFLQEMHAAGAPQASTNAALDSYYKIVEEQQAAILDNIAIAKRDCIEALRQEWASPGEYLRNDNVMQNYLGSLPEAVREAFDKGIDEAGIPLGYNPEIRKWLVSRALEENPLATVVPGAGANQASAIADEIAALEKRMGTDRKAWFKDEAAQERYRVLIDAQAKAKG